MKKSKARETRRQQAHPKAGATYSPRSLFRSLTVPYSTQPGPEQDPSETTEALMEVMADEAG